MKHILLFLLLILSTSVHSQRSIPYGSDGDKVREACFLLKIYSPEIYSSITAESNIQSFLDKDGERFSSTNLIEGGYDKKYWILAGFGSIRERSRYHLAAVIFHESMHMLMADKRMSEGRSGYFSNLSQKEQKQEEFFIYKMEIDLLVRMNAPAREIQEIREWMEPYKPR